MKTLLLLLSFLMQTHNSFALDDPMRPLETQDNNKQTDNTKATKAVTKENQYWYILYSTMITENRRLADINRKIVQEGDRVNGAIVKKIESDRVVIKIKNKIRVLSVSSNKGMKVVH